MEELKYLGDNVYMAYGKVVKVKDPSIDTSTDEGRKVVLDFMEHLFEDKFTPCPWGVLTAGVVNPVVDVDDGRKGRIFSCVHFGDLPDSVKPVLRKEFPDHADEI